MARAPSSRPEPSRRGSDFSSPRFRPGPGRRVFRRAGPCLGFRRKFCAQFCAEIRRTSPSAEGRFAETEQPPVFPARQPLLTPNLPASLHACSHQNPRNRIKCLVNAPASFSIAPRVRIVLWSSESARLHAPKSAESNRMRFQCVHTFAARVVQVCFSISARVRIVLRSSESARVLKLKSTESPRKSRSQCRLAALVSRTSAAPRCGSPRGPEQRAAPAGRLGLRRGLCGPRGRGPARGAGPRPPLVRRTIERRTSQGDRALAAHPSVLRVPGPRIPAANARRRAVADSQLANFELSPVADSSIPNCCGLRARESRSRTRTRAGSRKLPDSWGSTRRSPRARGSPRGGGHRSVAHATPEAEATTNAAVARTRAARSGSPCKGTAIAGSGVQG